MASSMLNSTRLLARIPRFLAPCRRLASSFVETEQHGKVLVVSINRPEKRNALNNEAANELNDCFKHFEIDDSAAVAVLCGKGGYFSAGFDLEELSSKGAEEFIGALSPPGEGNGTMGPTKLKLTKPVVGAIQGHAVGGGLELALMCDLRIAEESTVFGFFNRRFGIPLLDGGSTRLPYLIGLSRALDLIITGRAVHSDEALHIGLANRVVPNGEAVDAAIKLATKIAKFPQDALKADRKAAFYSAYNADSFYDALQYEFRKGVKIPTIKDSIAGAQKFQSGIGKKGSFEEF